MSKQFDADYFERGPQSGKSLYEAYRWLPELTLCMAHAIVLECGIRKDDTILDWGCAKGFLVKALRMMHHQAWGFDISDYAVSQAPEDVKRYLNTGKWARYDWIISKDVLEHVPYEELPDVLMRMRLHCRRAFIIVPLGNGKKYNFLDYEKDVTHIIREDVYWWKDMFVKAGFTVVNASTDKPFIKKSRCIDSDGFFELG